MPTRGRKPKPIAIKELEGNPGKRPLNLSEPKFKSNTEVKCPNYLTALAKKEWRRLAPSMQEIGILDSVNQSLFAAYCQCYAYWVENQMALSEGNSTVLTPSGYAQQKPQVNIALNCLKMATNIASEFGLTPSSRSRIIAGKPDTAVIDEMDKILRDE